MLPSCPWPGSDTAAVQLVTGPGRWTLIEVDVGGGRNQQRGILKKRRAMVR